MDVVKVNGIELATRGVVREIIDSTIFRRDGFCGCLEATAEWGVTPDYMAPWLKRGAPFEVIEAAGVTWNGTVGEIQRLTNGLAIHADGLGVQGAKRVAVYDSSAPGDPVRPLYKATGNADTAVDTQVSDFGLEWDRYGTSLGSVALAADKYLMLDQLLLQVAQAAGKFFEVGMSGEVRLVDEATDVTWMTSPGSWFTSEADDQWLTSLFGFAHATNPNSGAVEYLFGLAEDDEGADAFGYAADVADLLARGTITKAAADAEVAARLSLVGGRLGWAGSVPLTPVNLWRIGAGHASAMSPRAGDRITLRGGFSNRSSTAVMAGNTVTIGKVERRHSTRTAAMWPLGMVPRDLSAATRAADVPTSGVAGAA